MESHAYSVVFSGGAALGSYQAGVFDALQRQAGYPIGWIAGSSIGTVNGALIAGSAPDKRVRALEGYWLEGNSWNAQAFASTGSLRHATNWMNVVQARLFGSPRHLRTAGAQFGFASLYDLAPTVSYLRRTIDFGRLNSGDIRFTVATADVETGDAVIFDTGAGDRIELDHILASCGFLPEFAPVEMNGRLLADGGLALNAPVEPVLDELDGKGGTVFVVDLFARDGRRPMGLESALARKNGMLFGNSTYYRLETYRRLWHRHAAHGPLPNILYLSYLPADEEAGAEMSFDFSRASANDRWTAGFLDAQKALGELDAVRSKGTVLTSIRGPALRREGAPPPLSPAATGASMQAIAVAP